MSRLDILLNAVKNHYNTLSNKFKQYQTPYLDIWFELYVSYLPFYPIAFTITIVIAIKEHNKHEAYINHIRTIYKPSEKLFFPAHHPLQVTANTHRQHAPPALPPGRGGRGEVAGAQIGEEHPGGGRGRTAHGMMG